MNETLFYAGIGARVTPQPMLDKFTALARDLEAAGLTLRSGGANGADTAFEAGVTSDSSKHIYLPWGGFNDRPRGPSCDRLPGNCGHYWWQAGEIAATLHPAWRYLTSGAKRLHTRNIFQVLGDDLRSPALFVVCWTKDGAEDAPSISSRTGGTGTAIALAFNMGVPVFNFQNESASDRLAAFLQGKAELPGFEALAAMLASRASARWPTERAA